MRAPAEPPPQGIAGSAYAQLVGMVMDISDGLGKVFVGIIRTVDERKGIVAQFGQFEGMRKAVVHGSDVGKRTTGIAYGKGRTRIAPKKEQPVLRFCGSSCIHVRMFAEIFLVTHKGITRLLNRHVFLFVVSLSNVDAFLSAAQLPTFDYKKLF